MLLGVMALQIGAAGAVAGTYTLMTFNIRFGTAPDGPNQWDLRKQLVFDVLTNHQPDVVGLQEALRFQLDEIHAAVAGYGEVGQGRNGGTSGEYAAVLYRQDRFTLLDSGTFWFSPTPDVPGSIGWGAFLPRICTWARLADIQTAQSFYVANLHLDHQSQLSRYNSVLLLMDRISPWTGPVMVTGDFNAAEDNPAVVRMAQDGRFVDSLRVVQPEATQVGTFNGFVGTTDGDKIDFVFVRDRARVVDAQIIRDNDNGRYPSDHFPVTAVVDPFDCNSNGLDDASEIAAGGSDCNSNGVVDECEIDPAGGASGGPYFCQLDCDADCNTNGVPDACDLAAPGGADCNTNGVPDACEASVSVELAVIDGTADASYGAALSVQDTQTQFGDNTLTSTLLANGSELDAAYAGIRGGVLYLMLAGNLESNFNKLEIFVDSKPGGQNRLRGDNPKLDSDGLNRMGDTGAGNGLTFDPGFAADYWISLTGGANLSGGGNPYLLNCYYATLPDAGNGVGYFVGAAQPASNAGLFGGSNPHRISATINNSNVAGVTAGTGPDSGLGVNAGVELRIPLSAIGSPTGLVRICAFVNGVSHDFVSNQILAPIGGGGNFGEPRNVDFGVVPGLQYVSVDVLADAPLSADCNANTIPDRCEIDRQSTAAGGPFFCVSNCDPDCNTSGTPDACDPYGDHNGDGAVDQADLDSFVACISGPAALPAPSCLCMLDADDDGDLDLRDFAQFAAAFDLP